MLIKLIRIFIFFISIQSVYSLSKVAVLDAIIGEGIPINASFIVADTINEQFVKSSQYKAIDRTFISEIQDEKRFQLSGEVKEDEIKTIGNIFSADILCIAQVTYLGSTYSVSARLIEVATSEVLAQESHRMNGKEDILFTIAEIVGKELTGQDVSSLIGNKEDIIISESDDKANQNNSYTNYDAQLQSNKSSFTDLNLQVTGSVGGLYIWYPDLIGFGAGLGITTNIIDAIDLGLYTRWTVNTFYKYEDNGTPKTFISGTLGIELVFNLNSFSIFIGGGFNVEFYDMFGTIDIDLGVIIPTKNKISIITGYSLQNGILGGVQWSL